MRVRVRVRVRVREREREREMHSRNSRSSCMMDKRIVRRTYGWKDVWTHKQTDGQTNERTNIKDDW